MNSNNNVKSGKEIDVRDVFAYLLGKIWIIALVVVCCMIIAYLYTSLLITPVYSSSSSVVLTVKYTDDEGEDQLTTKNLSVSDYLAEMAPGVFMGGNFPKLVAEKLNSGEYDKYVSHFTDGKYTSFEQFYTDNYRLKEISGDSISSYLYVETIEDTSQINISITSPNPYLSAIICQAATDSMSEFANMTMIGNNSNKPNKDDTSAPSDTNADSSTNTNTDTSTEGSSDNKADATVGEGKDVINIGKITDARVATEPSNKHKVRNVSITAIISLVVVCAILVAFYIFDDKIKVPDDIEKHLKLSVLGEIPEIEEEV